MNVTFLAGYASVEVLLKIIFYCCPKLQSHLFR